jgi:hypothetical protein
MFMKKVLILCFIAILLLAISLNPGSGTTGITGILIQAGSAILTIARSVIKQILTFVVKVL